MEKRKRIVEFRRTSYIEYGWMVHRMARGPTVSKSIALKLSLVRVHQQRFQALYYFDCCLAQRSLTLPVAPGPTIDRPLRGVCLCIDT